MTERKSKYSIRFTTITVDGHPVIVYVVDDLDDELLNEHFNLALDREDYEYCEALQAEAMSRNLKIKVK